MLRPIVFRMLDIACLLLLAFIAPARLTLAGAPDAGPHAPQDIPDTIVPGDQVHDLRAWTRRFTGIAAANASDRRRARTHRP